jgi:hypothetical protein
MKACLVDRVDLSERRNITFDMLSVDEGLTCFFWHIYDKRGKLLNKKCIVDREMNLTNTLCIKEK